MVAPFAGIRDRIVARPAPGRRLEYDRARRGYIPIMPWVRRRRYDPRYEYEYVEPGWSGRRGYRPGNNCLRDACLLETGCCLAEGLDGNCLMAGLILLPRLLTTAVAPVDRRHGTRTAMLAAIRFYQREISAHRAPVCRFTPSCSEYAAQAIESRGAAAGMLLAARRLLRCRPGGARGSDPVPA
jgi:putative membrane protein insertion efficiency factor